VAAENDEHPFAIVTDKAIYSELDADKDGVVLFKKFDEGRNDFEGDLTNEALKKFIGANSLPLVVEFSHEVCYEH
jgi:protein disulfide-isomerase A1